MLFLDVDGVLNCASTFQMGVKGQSPYPLDQYMGFLVGKIKLYTDCSIVLSSSWRHHEDGVRAVETLVDILDVTPYLPGVRGDEIKAWLDLHPEVDRYAILDDSSDMLDEQLPNFFRTSWETGLTDEIAQAVIDHLNA